MATDKILIVVHQPTSNPGLVGQKLCSLGYGLDIRCPALGETLPTTLAHHAAVVVFGGPMSANDDDTLPYIRQELDWLPTVLDAEKPYLGICLGAQLLARALGAIVAPHPDDLREIGYFPLHPTPEGRALFPESMQVYHWHGEGFTVPSGGVALATGETFPHQAFRYGSAYGLQFHPEITADLIADWTIQGAEQLTLPGAHPRALHLHNHRRFGGAVAAWLDLFLADWLTVADWKDRASA
jgi:GMP synthase (glutamine-hydrolysing)